jgi:hypothetical protein
MNRPRLAPIGLPSASLIAGLALCLPLAAFGSTGLAFLKIGAGARSVALGDAVVSSVNDASANYWNPGALPFVEGTQVELMHSESFQGIRYEFGSLTHQFHERHAVGVAFNGTWTDNLRAYDESGEFQGHFGYYGVAMSASYGYRPWENVSLGAGLEYLREAVDVFSASGMGVNLGVQVRELLPRTQVGLSVLHLGSSVKYETESFNLPAAVQGGISRNFPLSALDGNLLVAAEVRKIRDEPTQLLLGTEYSYQEVASLEVGYRSGLDTQDVSLGFGVGNRTIRGQYAYVPFSENLGNQQRISVMIRW